MEGRDQVTLIITRPGYWRSSPYGNKARDLKLSGVDVQQLFTNKTLGLACKCGYTGEVDILEQQGKWAWGKCPSCNRPYIIEILPP